MKSIFIAVVASSCYSERLSSIILNQSSSLLDYDFSIFSAENGHSYNYSFSSSLYQLWLSELPLVYPSLRDNIVLLSGDSSCLPASTELDLLSSNTPAWLLPRELSYGDLSVISKHHAAITTFLRSTSDFALIFEDDVLFAPSSLSILHDLVQIFNFDYVDIAGGDGLNVVTHDLTLSGKYHLERKYNLATRTACCYLISRCYAQSLVSVLNQPFFPIDWSLSLALHKMPYPPCVYWLDSGLAQHGSSIGHYSSWRSQP